MIFKRIFKALTASAIAYSAAMSLAYANPEANACGQDATSAQETPCLQTASLSSEVAPIEKGDIEFLLNFIGMPNGCDGVNPASCKHAHQKHN